jgi:Zn-dependent peptidase ImmA (M78 family)
MLYGMRVEAGRALVGATQQDLAEATGYKQPLISMLTRGERLLTTEHAERFSTALGLPFAFFEIPPSSIPDSAIDFRKMKTASSKDTERAKTLFKEAFRVSATLVASAELPRPQLPLVQDAEPLLGMERIEEIAFEVRKRFRVDAVAPIPNVARMLERNGVLVAPLVVPGAKESSDQSKHFGASHWSGVGETALACYVPGSSGDRDRFTLSHELAHLVLHTFRPHVSPEDREVEANLLGAAILLPASEVRESVTRASTLKSLAAAKAQWGVSIQAIIMRGKAVGSMSEDRASMLFRQISARGWRKAEPVFVAHEAPKLIRRLLDEQFGAVRNGSEIERRLALPANMIASFAPKAPKFTTEDSSGTNVVRADFSASRS